MEYITNCSKCMKHNLAKSQRFAKTLKRKCPTCHKTTIQTIIGKVVKRFVKRNALVIHWL